MAIVLGFKPEPLTLYLSRHGDFVTALIYDDNDPDTPNEWPAGTALEIRFYAGKDTADIEATWPATITGDRAEWHIPRAQVVTDVLTPGNSTARLIYISPDGEELEWGTGSERNVR